MKEYQNAKIRTSDIEKDHENHEQIEEPSFDTLLRGENADLRAGSGSKKEIMMTQSILEAQIEPAENDSNYASTPVRETAQRKLENLQRQGYRVEPHYDASNNDEAMQHLKKALKSPRYGGLQQRGMENEFSSISINIQNHHLKAMEGPNTTRAAERLPMENQINISDKLWMDN